MTLVAPRILNDVSYVMRINHEIPFAWQAQCLVKLDCDSCYTPRIVNDVSCETRIHHEIHFAWQAQYLVKLDCDLFSSAHCK